MKLRYYILSILAGAALAAGCAQEQVISSIAEFKPEKSYIGLPLEGGINTTPVKATASWSFDTSAIPEWLTVSPTSGGAEVEHIVFAAEPNTGNSERSVNLVVNVGGKQQRFTVIQAGPGEVEAPLSTIAQVAAGNDGETFRIRGTVTSIVNTNYGNLYVSDDTGSIYIYGLFNAKGQYPKDAGGWATFGVEVGDVITVQGPRTLYNGTTLELVDNNTTHEETILAASEVGKYNFNMPDADVTITAYFYDNVTTPLYLLGTANSETWHTYGPRFNYDNDTKEYYIDVYFKGTGDYGLNTGDNWGEFRVTWKVDPNDNWDNIKNQGKQGHPHKLSEDPFTHQLVCKNGGTYRLSDGESYGLSYDSFRNFWTA